MTEYGGGYGRDNEEESDIMIVVLVSAAVYAISFLLLRVLEPLMAGLLARGRRAQ